MEFQFLNRLAAGIIVLALAATLGAALLRTY